MIRIPEQVQKKSEAGEVPLERYHLLGEMRGTPYGNLLVYYTGIDPGYQTLAPRRFKFFDEQRGYVIIQEPEKD